MRSWSKKARVILRCTIKVAGWGFVTVLVGLLTQPYLGQDTLIVVGILVTLSLGEIVGPFRAAVTEHLRPPTPLPGLSEEEWKSVYSPGKGVDDPAAAWVGRLERILFLAGLWSGDESGPVIIGAWLAFKLATKWEVWKNVFQIPTKIDASNNGNQKSATDLDYLRTRSYWSSWLLNRFLIGTLLNIIIAYLAVHISRQYWAAFSDKLRDLFGF